MTKKVIKILVICLVIPLVIVVGIKVFNDRAYAFISLCIAVLACVPLIISYEKRNSSTTRLVVLAVMIALSVAGRFVFSFLPHFKPVTAMVIITGLYLGYECGFISGAFTAVISNFIFGQGPWTPFQMFAWGLIGLISGLMAKFLVNKIIPLLIFSAVAGVLFSIMMDFYTTLWFDGVFNLSRFLANLLTALPVTITYAVSNVIFIFLLVKPFGSKLERLKLKYGI